MLKMGFDPSWVQKILNCVESTRYSMLLNGDPLDEFVPSRGLRQGDPLSPYLFLICSEGLSALLNREESLLNLSGLKINNYCPALTHLFFADDSLIFLKASDSECRTIRNVLKDYEDATC